MEQYSSTARMCLGKLLQNAHPYMKTLAAQSNALCLLVRQQFPHSFCKEPFSKLTAALSQSLIPNGQIRMHLINCTCLWDAAWVTVGSLTAAFSYRYMYVHVLLIYIYIYIYIYILGSLQYCVCPCRHHYEGARNANTNDRSQTMRINVGNCNIIT